MKRSARCFGAILLISASMSVLNAAPANAATSHRDPTMIDVDTPSYVGYDSTLRAYQFRVTGRWRPACGGKFCWPAPMDGNNHDIGSNDAAKIRFSGSVQFKRFRIRAFDACGGKTYDKTATFTSDSFQDAYAGVDDQTFVSWKRTTYNGRVMEDNGTCKLSGLPTSGACAAQGGSTGCYTHWWNLKAASFIYDVWITPAPSQGSCYDRLYVRGGYTHTWSTYGLSWSVGYPWGVGVGPVTGDADFTVYQGNDGYSDPDLITGRLCRH